MAFKPKSVAGSPGKLADEVPDERTRKSDADSTEQKTGSPGDQRPKAKSSLGKTAGASKDTKDQEGSPEVGKTAQAVIRKPREKIETPEFTKPTKVDFEPEITNEDLEYMFEGDYSDLGDFEELIEEYFREVADLGEGLSISSRLKKRATMRRIRSRINVGRKRALRRRATTKKIYGRAKRTAIQKMKTRFAGGRSVNSLTYSEKDRIERMVKRRRNAVTRSARRMIRSKRQLEQKRLQRH